MGSIHSNLGHHKTFSSPRCYEASDLPKRLSEIRRAFDLEKISGLYLCPFDRAFQGELNKDLDLELNVDFCMYFEYPDKIKRTFDNIFEIDGSCLRLAKIRHDLTDLFEGKSEHELLLEGAYRPIMLMGGNRNVKMPYGLEMLGADMSENLYRDLIISPINHVLKKDGLEMNADPKIHIAYARPTGEYRDEFFERKGKSIEIKNIEQVSKRSRITHERFKDFSKKVEIYMNPIFNK